jgi:hypothetical protein
VSTLAFSCSSRPIETHISRAVRSRFFTYCTAQPDVIPAKPSFPTTTVRPLHHIFTPACTFHAISRHVMPHRAHACRTCGRGKGRSRTRPRRS